MLHDCIKYYSLMYTDYCLLHPVFYITYKYIGFIYITEGRKHTIYIISTLYTVLLWCLTIDFSFLIDIHIA